MKLQLKDTVIETSEAHIRFLQEKFKNKEISESEFESEKCKNEIETKNKLKSEIEKIEKMQNSEIIESSDEINWLRLSTSINQDSNIFRQHGSVYNYRNSNIGISVRIYCIYFILFYFRNLRCVFDGQTE